MQRKMADSAQSLLGTIAIGTTIVSLATVPLEGFAQSVTASDGTQISEIVVTAQKRAENLNDVPLSISVLKGSDLEQQKVEDYQDLARIVPGLSVTNTGNSSLSRLSLRGVASDQGSATVGVYLEDISLTMPNINLIGETLPRQFDMAQLEVLRGPQGTLFGASSLGGAVRFIPNAPVLDQFEGEVRADVSNTHLGRTNNLGEVVLNLPLVDNLAALRVAFQHTDDSGFVTRYDLPIGTVGAPPAGTFDQKVGDDRTNAIRASVLIKPDDSFSIEPAVLYQRSYANGTNIFDTSYLPEFAQNRTTAEEILDTLKVESLTLHKDFDSLQFTSISGYVRRDNDRLLDAQFYDSGFVAFNLDPNDNIATPNGSTVFNTIAALKAPYVNNVIDEQFSQELRAGSKSIKETGSPYEWQVGTYFSNQAVKSFDNEQVAGLGQTLTALYPGETPAEVLGAPLVNDEVGIYRYETHTFEKALFGQVSYVILPKLTATAGLRKSWADIRYDFNEYGYFTIGLPALYETIHSENPVIPRLSLSYEISDDAIVYTTASKGYRLGGSNPPLPNYCAASFSALGISGVQTDYRSDSLWSYEVGSKLRFFDHRFSVDGALYYIDWSNIQQNQYLSSCGTYVTVNAGKARNYGGELQATARLNRNLSLTFTGAITDAHITDAAPGSGASDGQAVLFVPRANFSFGPDYEQPIGGNWLAHGHFDVNYTGTSHGTFLVTDPDYNRPDYTVVNLNAGVSQGAFDISFFARNLFDNDKEIQTPTVLAIEQGLRVRPRTLGVSVKYKF